MIGATRNAGGPIGFATGVVLELAIEILFQLCLRPESLLYVRVVLKN